MKSGLVLLVLLPVVAAQTTPPADPLDALVADSPFLPRAGGRGAAAGGATGPLELRGIVFEDGAYVFSIYDQASKEAVWVRLDERGQPFVARSFNRERDSLTVEHHGRTVVLSLQPARMAGAQAGAPLPPAPLPGAVESAGPNNQNTPGNPAQPPAQGPNAIAGAPTVPPSGSTPTATEAQRLQNLADEIRRRRGTGSQLVLPKKN